MLTLIVPTYNRPDKLVRLLGILKKEITSDLRNLVHVLVSDNSTNDQTVDRMNSFQQEGMQLTYIKQPINLGADGNFKFLYENATTPYVWFFADDDFPLPGSIAKVVEQLNISQPDIILSSFMQPPGSSLRQFNYPERVHFIHDPKEAIDALLKWRKISIYILRKVSFDEQHEAFHQTEIGGGWMFLILALSVLQCSSKPEIAVFSEQLASCDEDYKKIWVPTPFLHQHTIARHPFIQEYAPGLEQVLRNEGYAQCIIFSWALERGVLKLDDHAGLKKFIKKLKWRFDILLTRPKLLLMLVLMKLNLVSLFFKKEDPS